MDIDYFARKQAPDTSPSAIAVRILDELLRWRRRPDDRDDHASVRHHHLPRLQKAIECAAPLTFLLPAFPAKSPNPRKVLGNLPDTAERIALTFLNDLCQRIGEYHKPGARVLLCSDGHVFADTIRVADATVAQYQVQLRELAREIAPSSIEVVNLHDALPAEHAEFGFEQARAYLMQHYGKSADDTRAQYMADEVGRAHYRAITRFMFEDGLTPDYNGSRNALQVDSRQRAIEVIRRSQAWGNLLDQAYPRTLRLSIHPQAPASPKFGIHLSDCVDTWLTPWHAVAVDVGGQFRLMKREDVERAGGRVVHVDGRPSHFVIEHARCQGESR
ncbi:L-tyrosine/L-tryptophan isonitrile synthase family protein [Pinirhizobacter soli]|uniref:L-tyrosine/L-tryptophan isonitrile synthase family protein n=1 Tax=Pinirhizobacter soli TaxID=2786953 RepID=UPI00202A0F1F|nr:isocyanide synthase family protein [Pinirhizobacter soli]